MKTIFEKILTILKLFTPQRGFLIFLAGLFTLVAPHLYLWSFVALPSISIPLMILGVFSLLIQKIFLVLTILYALSAFILNKPTKIKMVSACFSAVLITGFFFSIGARLDFRSGDPAFLFGAKTRLFEAGGAEKVKTEALTFLAQQLDEDGYATSELRGGALKRMGVWSIKVDKEYQSVAVFIRAGNFMYDFDEWGYLFTDDKIPNIDFLKIDGYGLVITYWKLTDGIYFFNRKW